MGNEQKVSIVCEDVSIEKSLIPQIYLLKAQCDNKVSLTMDVHEEFNIFEGSSKILVEFLKEKPLCGDNEFCGQGYLFYRRRKDNNTITLISIGGFIVRLEGDNLLGNIGIMEKIYVKVKPF